MGDFDDDDFDIDELLGEIDAAESTKSKGKSSNTPQQSDAVSADKKPSGGKSVRFSGESSEDVQPRDDPEMDDYMPKVPRSQRSSTTSSLFLSANKPSTSSDSTKPPNLPSSSSRSKSGGGSGDSGTKNDWLGIQESKTSSPPSSSPPPIQRSRPQSYSQQKPRVDHSISDDEDELMKELNLQPRRSAPKSLGPSQNPTIPNIPTQPRSSSAAQPQQRSRFGGTSFDSTPPASLGGGGSGQQENLRNQTKSTFSSSYLDQLGRSPTTSPRGSVDFGKPPRSAPLPSTKSLLGPSNPPMIPSVKPEIPVGLLPPKQPIEEPFPTFSLAAPIAIPDPSPPQAAPATKKKVVKKDLSGSATSTSVGATLQLASHLINEEELKAMSSSLKTLYTNQLEQLQISYKEQLNFLSEANKRKEELLRDEMKGMQTEYEERLERLRNEVRLLESKQTLKAQLPQEEMAAITALSEQLNSSISTLRDVIVKSRELSSATGDSNVTLIQDTLKSILREHSEKNQNKMEVMEDKVCTTVRTVDESVARRFSLMNDAWRNLISQVKQNMTDIMETARASNMPNSQREIVIELMKLEEKMGSKMDSVMTTVEKLDNKGIHGHEELDLKLMTKFEETERALLGELLKVQKLQRRTKEATDGLTLEPLVKILDCDREEDQRKREKFSNQLKEVRRDLKRILFENENRLETSQKYNLSAEAELKSISQSIRDLNSQLKINLISGPSQVDNLATQFNASMQQTQAEMEMKLLRDERQALSESMSQINVEKRKLSEEKIHLEKQKLDFEKERDQLRNLEVQLKTKLEETEEIQRKTESVRREEIQLTTEAQVKMKELDKEKFFLKGKLMEAEQRFLAWEQKLRQEKMELSRERDFMEKLRDQLLCPGCMKPNEAVAGVVVHPPPPPYLSVDTSNVNSGFNRSPLANFTNDYFTNRSAVDGEDLYEAFRRKYFE